MFAEGLVEEVRMGVGSAPNLLSREAEQALGYKEIFDFLDGWAFLAETFPGSRREVATLPSDKSRGFGTSLDVIH